MTKRGGPKCGGKLHGRDGTCTLPAGWGTDHKGFGRCRKHLGNAPTVAKAAKAEQLERFGLSHHCTDVEVCDPCDTRLMAWWDGLTQEQRDIYLAAEREIRDVHD